MEASPAQPQNSSPLDAKPPASTPPAAKPRLAFLDAITGLMLLHMMLVHASGFADLIKAPFYVTFTPYDAVVQALFFFMPWFYFKAGVFINRKLPVKAFVRQGARRLLAPWASFTALGFLAFFAFGLLQGRGAGEMFLSQLKTLLQNGAVEGNMALWFLPSLFLVRLLYRVLPERLGPPACVLSAVAAAAALWHFGLELPLALSTVPAGFAFLMLGHYSKKLVTAPYIKYAGWGGTSLVIYRGGAPL